MINYSFSFKKLKDKFKNKRLNLTIVVILVVLGFSIYTWLRAEWIIKLYIEMSEVEPALLNFDSSKIYNLAFQKIILFAGIVFASTALLLKVIPDKKDKSKY